MTFRHGDAVIRLCGVEVKECGRCKLRGVRVEATKQCDFKLIAGKRIGKTCDAYLCASCAVSRGPDVDYCPAHAKWEDHLARRAVEGPPSKATAENLEARRGADAERWLDELIEYEDALEWAKRTHAPEWFAPSTSPDLGFRGELRYAYPRAISASEVVGVTIARSDAVVGAIGGAEADVLDEARSSPEHGSFVTLGDKVRYVKGQGQTRAHDCHWPGCGRQVPPARWGCSTHWFRLPKRLRDLIWREYRVGQERTITPSRAYVEAAREVQKWIAEHGGAP